MQDTKGKGGKDMSSKAVGSHGEQIACDHLERKGYEILKRNWHCRYGEMDIIARRGEEILFVEVKTRRTGEYGSPEDALNHLKKRALVRTAVQYLGEDQYDIDWRIDCIAIEMDHLNRVVRLEHFESIIEGEVESWV